MTLQVWVYTLMTVTIAMILISIPKIAIPVRLHHGANTAPPSLQGRRHSSGAAEPVLKNTNMSMSTHWQFQIDDLFWKHITFQGHPLDAETQPEAVCFCIYKVPFWRSDTLSTNQPTFPTQES